MAKEIVKITKIVGLLRSNNVKEADALIVSESNRIGSQIADLKRKIGILESGLQTLESLMPEGGQQSLSRISVEAPAPAKLTKSQKHKRRQEILRVALMVADDMKSFSPEDIARILASEGVPMGVAPNRVNTAISSFLRGNPDFERDLDNEGLYKKRIQNIASEEVSIDSARDENEDNE